MLDRAEWLRQRRDYLGASEVPAVCGLDPFHSPLQIWALKRGLAQDRQSAAGDMGNLFEGPLLAYYAQRHARTLTKPGTLRRIDFPWMAATPDAVTLCDRNVQAKMVGSRMVYRWDDGCPDYVQAQTQWEMWVTGLKVSDVPACLGGTDYQEYEVKRDDTAIGYLVEICSRFWRDNVIGGIMPDIDGTEETRRILAARFPSITAGMQEADPDFIVMAERYKEISRAISAVEEEKDMLANSIRLAIGEKAGLKWANGHATWKPDAKGVRRLHVHIKE